jgi:hypothetical protein
MKAFRDLVINIGTGCNHKPRSPFSVSEGEDEPIPQTHMTYTLKTPVKPGFRRPLTVVPDENLDHLDNGQFASAEILAGDSTFTIDPSSTEKSIKAWAYGDGALGDKVARIHADGHIGEGVVEVTLDIAWTVAHPDATSLTVTEGPDEPIPVP